MKLIRHALIMAAGRGRRMMPLTDVVPKPMVPLDGETTLIGNGIEKLTKRIPNVHITVGYKGSMLARHVIELDVATVLNTEGQNNSWWIFNTLMRHINEPIYVLTADNIIELDFDLLEKSYADLNHPACMVVPVKPVPGLDGDYIFHQEQRVTEINRHKTSEMYCSGVQILNPAKLNRLVKNEGDFYHVWNTLIAQKQLYVSPIYPKKWITIDTLEQLDKAKRSA